VTTIIQNQDVLWVGALAAAPVALLIAAMCRGVGRPATRHALWVLALLTFVVPGVLMATGWTQAIGRAILGVPAALAWAFPPERAGVGAEFSADVPGDRVLSESPAEVVGNEVGVSVESDARVEGGSPAVDAMPASATRVARERSAAWPTVEDLLGQAQAVERRDVRRGIELAGLSDLARRERIEAGQSVQRQTERLGVADPAPMGARAPEAAWEPAAAWRRFEATRVDVDRERKPQDAQTRKVGAEFGAGLADRLLLTLGQAVGLPLGGARPVSEVPATIEMGPSRRGITTAEGAWGQREDQGQATSPAHARGSVSPPTILDPIWNGLVSASGAMRAWVSAIARAAGSIWEIPAPPAALWVAGVVVIVVLGSARTLAGKAAVRKMQPVDRSDRRLVRDLSEKLGLRHAPRAFVVKARISPMVCGGLNPRIILPDALWRTLDLDARRAVLTHELAHLRRCDQWVRLIELCIGVLYWWHPVLWAVRRRIREEADLCCDAWVTTLFPGLRRSYAEALLRTRCYLSIPGATAPVAGLGMASARSRRFSRRLTMVMTGQTRPKTSPLGLALALAVGTAALVVIPSIAHASLKTPPCPPDKVTATGPATGPATMAGSASAPSARYAPTLGSVSGTLGSAPTLTAALAPTPTSGSCCTTAPSADAAPTPMATMPTVMDPTRLYGSLTTAGPSAPVAARYAGSLSLLSRSSTGATPAPSPDGGLEDRVGALEARIEALNASIQRLLLRLEGGASNPFLTTPETATAFRSLYSAPQFQVASDDGEQAWVEYAMPSDKAGALYEFMRRDDVPIYVSQGDGAISLQGTPSQQRVFAQFLAMIHPDGAEEWLGSDPFAGGEDHWREMAELEAAHADMGAQRVARAGTERELAAERALLADQGRSIQRGARQDALRAHQEALAAELRSRREQTRHVAEEARTQARRQMEQMSREAQRREERASQLDERAAESYARAENARNDQQRQTLESQAEALEAEAQALREAADQMREETDEAISELDEETAGMEEELEAQLESARAEIEEAMAEIEAQLAEASEEGEHAENCACTGDCTGEGCEDDCDENCQCRTGTTPATAQPAAPAAAARPARAPREARQPTPPAAPRPIRD